MCEALLSKNVSAEGIKEKADAWNTRFIWDFIMSEQERSPNERILRNHHAQGADRIAMGAQIPRYIVYKKKRQGLEEIR